MVESAPPLSLGGCESCGLEELPGSCLPGTEAEFVSVAGSLMVGSLTTPEETLPSFLLQPKNTEKTIIKAISRVANLIFLITITSFPK
jgi:hypothetical protein